MAAIDSDPAERGDFIYLTKAAFQFHISPRSPLPHDDWYDTGLSGRLCLYNSIAGGGPKGVWHKLKKRKHSWRSGDPEMQTDQVRAWIASRTHCLHGYLNKCLFTLLKRRITGPIWIFHILSSSIQHVILYMEICTHLKQSHAFSIYPWDYHKSDRARNSECPVMNTIA